MQNEKTNNEGREIKEHEIKTNVQAVTDKEQQHTEGGNEHGSREVVMSFLIQPESQDTGDQHGECHQRKKR